MPFSPPTPAIIELDSDLSSLYSDNGGTVSVSSHGELVRYIAGISGRGHANGNPGDDDAARIDTLTYPGKKAIYMGGSAAPFPSLVGMSGKAMFPSTILMDYVEIGCTVQSSSPFALQTTFGEPLVHSNASAAANDPQFYTQMQGSFTIAQNAFHATPSLFRRKIALRNKGSTGTGANDMQQIYNGNSMTATPLAQLTYGTNSGNTSGLGCRHDGSHPAQMVLRRYLAFDYEVSDSDCDDFFAMCDLETPNQSPTGIDKVVLMNSDSILHGQTLEASQVIPTLCETGLGRGVVRVITYATPNIGTELMITNAPDVASSVYNTGRSFNAVVMQSGINDIIAGVADGATLYGRKRNLFLAMVSAGYDPSKCVMATIPQSDNISGGNETIRTDCNALVLSQAAIEGYTAWDISGIHGTLDGTHFSAAQHAAEAPNLTAILQGMMSSGPAIPIFTNQYRRRWAG